MNAGILQFGKKAYSHMNSIRTRHSISDSIGVPIHRSHVQHRKQVSDAICSRFPGRRTEEVSFLAPVRRFCSRANDTSLSASISNSRPILWYLGMLKARPVLTKSVTSGLILTAADLTSQTITKSSTEGYDLIRTCRMGGFGMMILGPSLHLWFNFLSRVLPKQDTVTIFKKMLMGQAICAPTMNAIFFSLNAALQGESGKEIVARLKRDMLPTMINNAIYWPVCDFITFRFVPLQLMPLVNNSFSYVWTIYITYMASLSKPEEANLSKS